MQVLRDDRIVTNRFGGWASWRQTVCHEDLDLVRATAIEELASPTEDRYQFLVDTLLTGLPDPDDPTVN